jgi:nucleotide-binding universal stress UspA family protein
MISKILVAVDGSKHADKAFEYASELAKKAGTNLLIYTYLRNWEMLAIQLIRK